MAYTALKPVRFDKDYIIGENIPDNVIDDSRVKDLVQMGLISKAPVSPDNVVHVGRPKITLEYKETGENGQNQANTERVKTDYTVSKLNPMKKEQLIEIAHKMGIGLEDDLNKKEIIEVILQEQEYINS